MFEPVQAYKCLSVCKPRVFESVQAYKCLHISFLVISEAGFAMKIGMNDVMLKVAVHSYYSLDGADFESQ